MIIRFLAIMVIVLHSHSAACAQKLGESECDKSKIDWVLPGHFAEALDKAKRDNRILMIKGVSFGIDEVGARYATKGKW